MIEKLTNLKKLNKKKKQFKKSLLIVNFLDMAFSAPEFKMSSFIKLSQKTEKAFGLFS